MTATTPADTAERIARELHEARARRTGDGVTWSAVAATSRTVMVAAVSELIERGVINAGPATGVLPPITAPEAAERAAVVLRMAEASAGVQPSGATALAAVAAEYRHLAAALATTRGMNRDDTDE